MPDVNECTFTGTIVKEPIMRYLPNGSALTTFRFKVVNGKNTVYLSVSTFDEVAEAVNEADYKEGSRVRVKGRLTSYSTEKDGVKTYGLSLTATSVERDNTAAPAKKSAPAKAKAPAFNEDEAPF